MRVWNAERSENGGGRSAAEENARKGPSHIQQGRPNQVFGREYGGTWHPNPKRNVWYRVSYATKSPACECEYHATGGQSRCKRMAIVGRLLPVAAESEYDSKEIAMERQCMKCPKFPSKEHARDRWHYGEHQKRRRCRRSKCGRRFSNNLGFWVPPHAARLHHAGPDGIRHAGCLWPTYG